MKPAAIVAGLLLSISAASNAQERCGLAKDFMVRALERIGAHAATSDIEDGLQLLKHASEECAGLGDAWYYRSLFEKKLGHPRQSDYARRKAKLVGSEALDQNLDPFTLSAAPGTKLSPAVHDKWALVIGISKFNDKRIGRLRYASKDARDMASTLQDPTYGRFKADHVHLLTDEQATTVKVKSELNWLARSAARDDLAVIFLSSHGSAREKDIAGVNYIVTHDTNVADQDSLYATALPMVEVADIVRTRMKVQRAVVFLDTCHSGGAISGAPPAAASPANLERIREGVGRVIIASSQVNERSWESDRLGNGYFTYFLIHALKQGNNPILRVFAFLREQVSRQVLADIKVKQTPVISHSDQGDGIVLGITPGAAVAAVLRAPS